MTASSQASSLQILKRILLFLSISLLFWISGGLYCIWLGYQESFLTLNAIRSDFWDGLMPHLTHLGDGLLLSSLIGFFLLPHKKAVLLNLILTLIVVSLFISLSKSYLFSDWYRPLRVFENSQEIFYISLDRLTRRSFPSGHSAAAGVILTFAAFAWERAFRLIGFLSGLLLILISYSRVYIGVHFLGDILVGSLLGVAFSALSIFFFHTRLESYFLSLAPRSNNSWTRGLYGLLILVLLADIYRLLSVYYWESMFT